MGRNSSGVVFSIHQVMGSTGSDIAASGSFLTSLQRWIMSLQGVAVTPVKSSTSVAKNPILGSSARGVKPSSGMGNRAWRYPTVM